MKNLLQLHMTPDDVKKLSLEELPELATEIRHRIIEVITKQTGGHLGAGLGVVELTIALHYVYDLKVDRLVFDVGHQVYPHKILTGRNALFPTIRQHGGITGFPNKFESPYDLFTSAHAGTATSTSLGLHIGDRLLGKKSHSVCVLGDGGLTAGMSLEALNNAGHMDNDLLVILNDNEMSISPSVGALSGYLTKIRTKPFYQEVKNELHSLLHMIPLVGPKIEWSLENLKEILKHNLLYQNIFMDLGLNYFGPTDGHDVIGLVQILKELKERKGPKLLHLITIKGKGLEGEDESRFHAAVPPKKEEFRPEFSGIGKKSYTKIFGETLCELAEKDPTLYALTAAMMDGTGLNIFQKKFPTRCFDVGICEQHGVGFAAGLATSGIKIVAAIYSTFLQRAYDQVFHEVSLQKNHVVFCMDRAGVVGADGETHNGVFDIAYLRTLPHMILMAPRSEREFKEMLYLALYGVSQPVAIRYPRSNAPEIEPAQEPVRLGKGVIVHEGEEIALIAYGTMVNIAMDVIELLAPEGIQPTVVNARFAKPLDRELLSDVIQRHKVVFTLEEHAKMGGFGSAVLEMACEERLDTRKITVLGLPDEFVIHGIRAKLLDEVGLSARKIAELCIKELAEQPVL
ncbi:MAG: 1-deoxy-D-xylulose-5-phosphate synthase [Planctomycetota bacterium]